MTVAGREVPVMQSTLYLWDGTVHAVVHQVVQCSAVQCGACATAGRGFWGGGTKVSFEFARAGRAYRHLLR